MSIDLEGDDLNKFILVGDRVLIKPKNPPKNQIGFVFTSWSRGK